MPVLDQYQRVPCQQITVLRDSRQRRTVETEGLRESIAQRGVLQPIIVHRGSADGELVLVAGERRLTASLELGLPDIPVRFTEDLSPIELKIIELDENVKRKDICWQDQVTGLKAIHDLYKQLNAEWTQQETSRETGFSQSNISAMIRVAENLTDTRIASSGTYREAYNIITRREARASGEMLDEIMSVLRDGPLVEKIEVTTVGDNDGVQNLASETGLSSDSAEISSLIQPAESTKSAESTDSAGNQTKIIIRPSIKPQLLADPAKSILHESFLQWGPRYSGKPFNLIHCDFPYGVGLFSSNGQTSGDQRSQMGRDSGQAYNDRPEDYFRLLACLCENLDRLLSQSGHLLFWFSEKHGRATRDYFSEHARGLVFQPFPLIWFKSDNAGIAADVTQGPRHVYETCLMATRGRRQIVQVVSDLYASPTDKRFHISAKPEPMLKHFFKMLVDGYTRLLDPTCGGGSAIRAAEALGAELALGMDSDEQTVGVARMALRQARNLRGASALLAEQSPVEVTQT